MSAFAREVLPFGSLQQNSSIAAQAPAQNSGLPVTGIVRSAEMTPIPGAMVRITNSESKKSWASWTDESGKFEFPALPQGRYHVEASQIGFVPFALDVELPLVPPGPIPMLLQVATLAELTLLANANPEKKNVTTAATGGNSSSNSTNAAANSSSGNSNNAAGNARRNGAGGGRQELPPGVSNAMNQGMGGGIGSGGFQQTELTGESSGRADETTAPQNSRRTVPLRATRFYFKGQSDREPLSFFQAQVDLEAV
jgi:hypothetical protein